MRNYPLLDLFLTMLYFFLWVAWIFLLVRIVLDIFRSADLGGWAKAGWLLFILVLPFLGVLVYLVARGGRMHEREVGAVRQQEEQVQQYLRQAVHNPPRGQSTASELERLAALRDQGVLTDDEFTREKSKVLA